MTSGMTIYAKCDKCHRFNTLYEWGTEDLCRDCIDVTITAMGAEPRPEPQKEGKSDST